MLTYVVPTFILVLILVSFLVIVSVLLMAPMLIFLVTLAIIFAPPTYLTSLWKVLLMLDDTPLFIFLPLRLVIHSTLFY